MPKIIKSAQNVFFSLERGYFLAKKSSNGVNFHAHKQIWVPTYHLSDPLPGKHTLYLLALTREALLILDPRYNRNFKIRFSSKQGSRNCWLKHLVIYKHAYQNPVLVTPPPPSLTTNMEYSDFFWFNGKINNY